jgi:zinc protease
VGRFGFVAPELERQKRATLRRDEQYLAETDKHESATLADEYVRNFTTNEPLPGPAMEYALHDRFLPQITLDEVNAAARTFNREQSRVVMVSAPGKPGVTVPDEKQLAAVVAGAGAKEVTAYADTVGSQPLMARLPNPALS